MTTTETEDTESTSIFVRRTTRATLAWVICGGVTTLLSIVGWMALELVQMKTEIAVLKESRFTASDADNMRKEIETIKDSYKDSTAVLTTRIELWDLKFQYIESSLNEIKLQLKDLQK